MSSGEPARQRIGPLHPLDKVQSDVASPGYKFPSYLVQQVRESLGDLSEPRCYSIVRALIVSLASEDYAWVEPFTKHQPRPPRMVRADVYGKIDTFGLWFIKFEVYRENVIVYSCHLSVEDMTLMNGKHLKKAPQ